MNPSRGDTTNAPEPTVILGWHSVAAVDLVSLVGSLNESGHHVDAQVATWTADLVALMSWAHSKVPSYGSTSAIQQV